MGREVRRVPLDFNHPLNVVWHGFKNPKYDALQTCRTCRGEGMSDAANSCWYSDDIRSIPYENRWKAVVAKLGEDAAVCPECKGNGKRFYRVALNLLRGLGAAIPTDKIIEYGWVEDVPTIEAAFELWEETPPPTGEGWQLWENTSNGSPITPVFATRDELVTHCVDSTLLPAGGTATREEWEAMFDNDHFFSTTIMANGQKLVCV